MLQLYESIKTNEKFLSISLSYVEHQYLDVSFIQAAENFHWSCVIVLIRWNPQIQS